MALSPHAAIAVLIQFLFPIGLILFACGKKKKTPPSTSGSGAPAASAAAAAAVDMSCKTGIAASDSKESIHSDLPTAVKPEEKKEEQKNTPGKDDKDVTPLKVADEASNKNKPYP
ncbi:hypothetical protein PFISCL1PPCAC_12203, partial [Pristionchus fissidentatus]